MRRSVGAWRAVDHVSCAPRHHSTIYVREFSNQFIRASYCIDCTRVGPELVTLNLAI